MHNQPWNAAQRTDTAARPYDYAYTTTPVPAQPPVYQSTNTAQATPAAADYTVTYADAHFAARQELVETLGMLMHHIMVHGEMLPKLHDKAANIARRAEVTREVAQLVHEFPIRNTLNGMIEKYGAQPLRGFLEVSHIFYESLGDEQTKKLLAAAGLDLPYLKQNPDLEHLLSNIENLVIAGSPAVVNNLLAPQRGQETVTAAAMPAPAPQWLHNITIKNRQNCAPAALNNPEIQYQR